MAVIYLAGPLFTQAEWLWNAQLAAALRERGYEVILPQEGSEPMVRGEVEFDSEWIFRTNVASIDRADVVVAVLDQPDPDSGTCWECGYAFHAGIPVIGLRTDLRVGGDTPVSTVNLMLAHGISRLVTLPLAARADLPAVVEGLVSAIENPELPQGN
jgi:nucleoside 2-deoxyribosyltransferase